MIINTDIVRRADLVIRRGNSFNKVFNVIDANGAPFIFTDYSASLEVYTSASDQVPNLVFESGDGLNLSLGTITLTKTADQLSTFRDRSYLYYLWVTDADGFKRLWLNGRFIVHEGVCDNFTDGINIEVNSLVINTNGNPINLTIKTD